MEFSGKNIANLFQKPMVILIHGRTGWIVCAAMPKTRMMVLKF
jgi:hypothetical protein